MGDITRHAPTPPSSEECRKTLRERVLGKAKKQSDEIAETTYSHLMGNSLLQEWVWSLSWKMQTTLLTGLRGPDAARTPEIKSWVRWIRSVVVNDASPSEKFMRKENRPPMRTLEDQLDMLPVHYFSHLMHALQIIGHFHHDSNVQNEALTAYRDMCKHLHTEPESLHSLEMRLKDSHGGVD